MPDIKYTHENKKIILARIKELIERNNFIDAHNMIEALDVDNILLQRLPGKHDHNDLTNLLKNHKKELCEEIKAQKYLVTKSPKLSRLKETKNEILPSRQISILMGESPKIVKCKPDDKIFLYTPGLGPCMGAMLSCELKNGKHIIGIAHLIPDDDYSDHLAMYKTTANDIDNEISSGKFKSHELSYLVNLVKTDKNYSNETIKLYFAGGQGSQHYITLYQLYAEYAATCLDNVIVEGILFDPFQITDEIDQRFSALKNVYLSTTAGITASGKPIIIKSHDIHFEYDINKFQNTKSISDYFSLDDFSKEKFITSNRDRLVIKSLQEIENIIVTKLGINDEAVIRLFVQPTTYCIDQLIEIIHLLNNDIVQHFLITNYKKNKLCKLSEKLRHIDKIFDLTLILQLLNDSEKEILIKQLGPDNLEKYFETSKKLIAVIQLFPKEKQISVLDSIGKKRLFSLIEYKEMLIEILRSEAQKDVKHYILLLYDKQKIVNFIQDMSSLLLVLESLSKEEQIDLFGDHALQVKIQGFEFNAKLFKVIASELLLKITMEIIGFDQIISSVKDDCDLIYLCKSIPGEFFDYFISKILDSEKTTNFITNSQTIISLCKLVPPGNLSNFINTYLITYIHKVVLDCNNFKEIYALIPMVDLEIFLTKVLTKKYYQKLVFQFYDIVAIFQTLKNMPMFINKLIEENSEIIKREIKNHHLLLSLLSSINEENRLFLLKKIGFDFINRFSDECKTLKERLVKLLPESQKLIFLTEFNKVDRSNQIESFSQAMPALTQHAGLLKNGKSIEQSVKAPEKHSNLTNH